MIDALLNVPGWLSLLLIVLGFALIRWDIRRNNMRDRESRAVGAAGAVDKAASSDAKTLMHGGAEANPTTSWTVRLGDRSTAVSGVSIVATSTAIYALSSVKSLNDGATKSRIRIDALELNGERNKEFGENGAGYIIFSLPGSYRPDARRIVPLNEGGMIVVGTAFEDETALSHPFLVRIDKTGSLFSDFGRGGFTLLPMSAGLNYGWDAVQVGERIYTICSSFESSMLTLAVTPINLRADSSIIFQPISIFEGGTVWPSRIVRVFPETAFYIIGKSVSAAHQTDGFIAKVDATGKLDSGFGDSGKALLKTAFNPAFINNCSGAAVISDGVCLIGGFGNDAFMVAVGPHGNRVASFSENGVYCLRGVHRTYASSVAASTRLNVVALSGMESDGNSIERAFVAFTDLRGNDLRVGADNMERVSSDAKTKMVDHVISDEGAIFGLVQEGGTSQGSQRVAVVRIPVPQP
ncbi:hypothetical protein [Thalassobaculum litoreum]|uniref:Delta-60 repeat domain-containing protein n=1 Tax=Thalassobaculum litoreum DSM 18839 TaxID=1123362 RepID=A0A8G2F2Z0_9PROT|nr:hypothetical protein [Thalassobaculum litoreum]SDF73584.1 hypothetical protein SAMN05660686_02122 [Thalassobaculum litoreum DSM 18839]